MVLRHMVRYLSYSILVGLAMDCDTWCVI